MTEADEKAYICDKCGERITDESLLISETDPDLWQNPLREVCLKIREQSGEPTPPAQLYHRQFAYSRIHRSRMAYLCGTLHPETEQEYFVHWIGYGMKTEPVDR